jgi:repressor LexA
MENPTVKQRQVLDLFVQRWERGESPPTHREICERFGFKSPKAAADHIAALKRKGYLMDDPHHPRGVSLTEKAMGIPILGQIPAGQPVDTEEATTDYLTLNTKRLGISNRSNAYFLRVKGDSMTGRHIFDGDLVLVEKSKNCRNQDVVAALIDNESTLKTLIRKDGVTWLRSENPKYPDLIPAWDLQIQGVARGVFRLFTP